MAIKAVAVCGAGVMGSGIAQVAAMNGFHVKMIDISEKQLDQAFMNISSSLNRFQRSGKITEEEKEAALNRIDVSTDLGSVAGCCDIVFEAIPENKGLKKELIQQLDCLLDPNVIIASNTSQFSITELASAANQKERIIGTHWFAPPVLMKLIEIVPGLDTDPQVLEQVLAFAQQVGKETIVCKDSQGFVTSRANMAFFAECFRIYEEGLCSLEDIDKAMRLGLGHSMGPFQISDLSGNDTVLFAMKNLAEAYGDRFNPPQTLVKMVNANRLGRKNGKGFYHYESE